MARALGDAGAIDDRCWYAEVERGTAAEDGGREGATGRGGCVGGG